MIISLKKSKEKEKKVNKSLPFSVIGLHIPNNICIFATVRAAPSLSTMLSPRGDTISLNGASMRKHFLLLLLIWACTQVVGAMTFPHFQFRHLAVSDGLPSNTVRAITQDEEGFIWMGTDEGLCRYDGISVKPYAFDNTRHDHFVGTLLYAGGKIWAGTSVGIQVLDLETERFTPFERKTAKGERVRSLILSMARDKEGNIWIATRGQGMFKYDPRRDYLENYPMKGIGGQASDILVDSDNQVWAVSNWKTPALWRLNKAKNTFAPVRLKKGSPTDQLSLKLFEDSKKNLWLGTWESGLWRIDRDGDCEVFAVGATHIHDIEEYAPGQLLVGSDDGLSLVNTETGQSQTYIEDETQGSTLSCRFIYPIMKDREGGIWIGTFYAGVNYVAPNAGCFVNYTPSRLRNSVGGSIINHFCEDAAGNVWIASDDGGLSCLSARTGKFTNYLPQKDGSGLSYHNVHALCVDGDKLWIGTYTGGINVLDTRTGRFRHYHFHKKGATISRNASSYAICKDSKGNLWAGSMDDVSRYDPGKDDFEVIKRLNALTIDIDEDAQGDLWFSTQGNGLFRYQPKTRKWKQYLHDSSKSDLAHNQVNCTYMDSRQRLWAGTQGGLYLYDRKRDRFERVRLDIPNQQVTGIVEDDNAFWLTTGNGLVKYDTETGCQVFTRRDGLLSNQFLPNAIMKASDGRIFIGSNNGFNAFYPHYVKTNRLAPTVRITGLDIFNEPVAVGSKILPHSLNATKEIHLSCDDDMFSLSFAALSYCVPEKNRYAYRLDGFDKEWNMVGAQHTATYTNLPPGTYTFRVKASNNDGVWSEDETQLTIVIHPPFYLSLPAKILYACLFVLGIYLLVRYFLWRKERQHAIAIKRLNAKKETEIHNAKITFFTMVAHEIRTPVSLIIGPLEKIMKPDTQMPDAIRDDLGIIDRNAHRLLYLVNQLLDFRKIEEKSMAMRFAPCNIKQLIHAVDERFAPTFKQQGITFDVVYPDDDFTAIVDNEAITKVISNLLTNARKYTKDRVELRCEAEADDDLFRISVNDNGIGINEEDQEKIFRPFFQAKENKPGTGIGLSIVKNIVDMHHGMIEVKSRPGEGTRFVVTLPVKQANVVIDEHASEILDTEAARPQPQAAATPTKEKKKTMLVVDDNEDMVRFLADSFRQEYRVLTATDGIDALNQLKEHEVALIISDWMMPRMDGVELCRTVRSGTNTSHIPYILLTAKTDNESKVQGMDCGADLYIEKPFSIAYLEACIKNMLSMRRLLREKFSHQPLEPLSHITNNLVDNEFLEKMKKIIEDNFSNPDFSVNLLADQLFVSRSGLFAKIKALADITPNEMIQLTRLKKAASLLATGNYQVSEVCYMVGFNNPSYFSKCFLKQFGVKPSDFIQQSPQT